MPIEALKLAFLQVESAVSKLEQLVLEYEQRASIDFKILPLNTELQSVSRILLAYKALTYIDGQSADSIRSWHGYCILPSYLILQAKEVNLRKLAFAEALSAYWKAEIKNETGKLLGLPGRQQRLAAELRSVGLARVHLLQTMRQIPIIDHELDYAGFSLVNKEVKTKTYSSDQVRIMLNDAGFSTSRFEEICKLQPNASFCRVIPCPPRMVMNYKVSEPILTWGKMRDRFHIRAELPVLIVKPENGEQVRIKLPRTNTSEHRKVRTDKRRSEEMVLPELGLYLKLPRKNIEVVRNK
ncbi:hypothetical protein LIN78_16435 [Leeia sp. TBRC 13508]|uniref:Uncharacterized protein n=1 Tax=Leeia speluncae TaxID=2884804 RepID=A0ABS8DAA0_9NEIS|nr:hypothetical protein [Leeia speluncae]MCB6185137.1 hypothetical protein [Leeia speluncae]